MNTWTINSRRLRARTPEFKAVDDDKATVGETLGKLNDEFKAIAGRIDGIEAKAVDAGKLAEQVTAIAADLADVKGLADKFNDGGAATAEVKALGDKFTGRLDDLEKRINAADVDRTAGGGGGRKSRDALARTPEFKALDAAMREGREASAELKALDDDLKTQQVFFDGQPTGDFPLLDRVYRRPTTSETPKYSYYTGGTCAIKGNADSQGAHKKVAITVQTYYYQPTLDREDVDDVGALLLQTEQATHVESVRETLNAALVDAIEAAGVAKAEIADEYTEVAIIETAVADTLDADDLADLVAELPTKYRRGAVMIANRATATTLRAIVDGNDAHMWAPSLKEGVPATLMGYAFIEDDNVADGRVIFTNPARGLALMEREPSILSNIERSAGDYLPYFAARYGLAVTDARASKILDTQAAG